MRFEVIYQDKNGETKTKHIEGSDKNQVVTAFKNKGLSVISCEFDVPESSEMQDVPMYGGSKNKGHSSFQNKPTFFSTLAWITLIISILLGCVGAISSIYLIAFASGLFNLSMLWFVFAGQNEIKYLIQK